MNDRQKRFADEYLIDLNAEAAAIRAGYSPRYARGNAHKLVANSGIQEYIKNRMDEKENELIASQDEVLETLTRVLRREEKETVVVTCKEKKSYYDSKGKKVVEEKESPVLVEIPTKISDVNKAAELLAKRHGSFTDKEEQRARIDKLKAETARIKGEDVDTDQDDGFIEALKGEVSDTWEDE